MNIAVNNAEEKAVHSWSRISSAGHKVLEEALRVFNPMSKDLSDTETQLVAFIQGLKEEGYQPTILRSKDVYGYSSLSVVLEALVPLKTPASRLESKLTRGPLGISPSDLKLLQASGPPRQFPSGKAAKICKRYKRLVKKAPTSATLTFNLLKGPKGGVLQESNACKASGVLNGRITGSSSQGCTAAPPSKALKIRAKEALVRKTEWKDGSTYQETVGQKRKRAAEAREAPQRKRSNAIPVQSKSRRAQSTLNLLKFRAIKVGNSSSDDEVRRRAQKILRVNLSPVIRIQPLSHS
ncbi:Coiled-coil domain-containing protein 71, partial [Anas platyrhynchos]